MSRRIRTFAAVTVAVGTTAVLSTQNRGNPTEWPTSYGDAQHTSWVRSDVHISPDSLAQAGFELQWTTKLESPARHGASLTAGVVTSAVTLFTPISTVAGTANRIFAIDNDTGNVFWTRQFEGDMGTGSTACPGGISGAPTRIVNLTVPPPAPARGGGAGRAAQSYSSAVGEPGAGVPVQPGGGRGGQGRAAAPGAAAAGAPPPAPADAGPARGGTGPVAPAPAPASPFPTNPQAVAAAGGAGGNLFRSSGVIYAVSGDGKLRKLGLVSGKDVQRPADFLPAGARFSDLIAVGDLIYTTTTQPCGNAPNAIWAMNVSGDPGTARSWKTGGGSPIGSVVFTTSGTLIAAIGPGPAASGGYANAIVALDPKTLALKDWYQSPSEVTAAPIVFQDNGRDIVAATTGDHRLLLLDAASLGGADHATPLFTSALASNGMAFASQSPAMWQERGTPAAAPAGTAPVGGPAPALERIHSGGCSRRSRAAPPRAGAARHPRQRPAARFWRSKSRIRAAPIPCNLDGRPRTSPGH